MIHRPSRATPAAPRTHGREKSQDTGKSDAPEQQEGPENSALLGEIEQGPSKLEEADAHQKKLFCLVGLLIVGVSGFIIVDGLKEKKEVDAGQALVSSKDREDFENLIKERPDTSSRTAQVQLARALWDEGDSEKSKKTLRDFIAAIRSMPPSPTPAWVLASYLLEEGEDEEAIQILRELCPTPRPLTSPPSP